MLRYGKTAASGTFQSYIYLPLYSLCTYFSSSILVSIFRTFNNQVMYCKSYDSCPPKVKNNIYIKKIKNKPKG